MSEPGAIAVFAGNFRLTKRTEVQIRPRQVSGTTALCLLVGSPGIGLSYICWTNGRYVGSR
jgi:hypothetical protein